MCLDAAIQLVHSTSLLSTTTARKEVGENHHENKCFWTVHANCEKISSCHETNNKADAKRRAEHELKVAQQKAAAAAKRAKQELDKYEREKNDDAQRYTCEVPYEGGTNENSIACVCARGRTYGDGSDETRYDVEKKNATRKAGIY